MIRCVLIGDYSKEIVAHSAIPKALALAGSRLDVEVTHEWLATDKITSTKSVTALNPDAIWCVPGSPYRNMEGALAAIRFARENNIPFLGTCGGFQHAMIEYARNVLHLADADHTESNPDAKTQLIAKLSCALINQSEKIRIKPNTMLWQIYGASEINEAYQCSYGLNPEMLLVFQKAPMVFSAFSSHDDAVRAFELPGHPFFVGTLFQPERSASSGHSHPLIVEFVRASA
jgi:CTP synthase (UTP-ammonia lyase)